MELKQNGPIGYFGLIANDENATNEIKTNAGKFMTEYSNIVNGQQRDFCNLILLIEILLGICIISIGIILLKTTNNKLFATAFIISGTLSIIAYIFFYCLFL